MPNTREKLIELLDDVIMCGKSYKLDGMLNFLPISNETIADHLIANGVTVQGDKEEMLKSLLHTVKDMVDKGHFLFAKSAPNGNVIVGWKLLVPGEIAAPAKPEWVKAVTNFGTALEAMKDGARGS